ncbi:MAG: hypothetical protein MI866_06140, partial [Bacteroidales bacterium]|nr:hypothetical protein [Bacteroidales bacterium]
NTDIKQSTTIYISIWLIILSVTIPFDIRDIRTDHLKMKTIPQLIGINSSIYLSQACLAIGILLNTLAFFSFQLLFFNTLFLGIALYCLQKIKNNASQNYINFYIEGLPVLWLAFSYLSSVF